jgi:excisionase family DNA binding protein
MAPLITRPVSLDDLPELCRVEEVAQYYRCSKGMIYEMVKRGDLPVVRLGRLVRIRRSSLNGQHTGDE